MSSWTCHRPHYCFRMMECAFWTWELRTSCLGDLGPQRVPRTKRRTWLHGCLCLFGGDPSNLGRPPLALCPGSLGSALARPLTRYLTFLDLRLLVNWSTWYLPSRTGRTIICVIGPFRKKVPNKCLRRKVSKTLMWNWFPLTCASVGDWTCNPGMCPDWDWTSALSVHRMTFQPTEPHWPGTE